MTGVAAPKTTRVRRRLAKVRAVPIDRIRWPAALALSSGAGLLCVGLADAVSRGGADLSVSLPVFWLGMLLMFGPATARLVSPATWLGPRGVRRRGPTGAQRLLAVVVLAVGLYLVKVMVSPLGFALPDEFSHWRTLEDMLRTGRPFSENPLLQISPIYPGLEATVANVMTSTGLDAFPVAMIVIGVGRVLTILALFLLAARISHSTRVAGVASLIYMANPSFLAFDTAFAYESLALPLALVAIWAIERWTNRRDGSKVDLAVGLGAIAACAVTHHLTSLALLVFLSLWAVISFLRERATGDHRRIAFAALFAAACSVAWVAIAGTLAFTYLSLIVGGSLSQLVSILTGADEAKRLFAARAGLATPLPEVLVAYTAVGLIGLSLPFMLWHAVRSRRPSPIVLLLVLIAMLYPPTLALRFTLTGSEISQRSSEFVFIAIAILGADWLLRSHPLRSGPLRWLPLPTRVRSLRRALAPALLVIVAGGIVTGDPPIGRLPGPYHAAAEQRSFEPEGKAAAAWALVVLGPDNRLIADRTNAKLMGSIGLQYPVTSANSHLGTAYVMFAQTLGPTLVDVLRNGHIHYVVVDLRLGQEVPAYPYVFEQSEPDAGNHTTPMSQKSLQKWDSLAGVRRIYDSGNILIYDVTGLVDGGA